jgi:DNA polymerase II small subunit
MASEILKMCMAKGFLLDKEMLEMLSELKDEGAKSVIETISNLGVEERVITKSIFTNNFKKIRDALVNYSGDDEMDHFFIGMGYKGENLRESGNEGGGSGTDLTASEAKVGKVKLLSAPAFPQKKVTVKDFVKHFRSRYEAIKAFLEVRDFDDLTSIRKIGNDRGSYTIIVSIMGKRMTKNKNMMLDVEDMTGVSRVLVNHNKQEVFDKALDLLPDDIIAINVSGSSEMLFANDLNFPEGGLKEKRTSDFDEYVAFSGDFHAGSTMFLEDNLLRFVKWLNGEEGDERQRRLAKKVRYLFLTGDNIDGVSHYPGQEKYLIQKTSRGQYEKVEEILKLIRSDIQIIVCPGQHDSVWVGEPQPIIGECFAEGLHKMENVHLVPNPSLVEIDGGFKVLMYHGASINRFIDEIPEIRTNFGHRSPTRVVKEMLRRRHLAPMHGGMDYIPCEKGDPMVIDIIPDILATADQHRPEISMHNNVLLIASSCWQSITPFEEKVGNVPDPCKVPLFNLKTREIKILDFSDGQKEIKWEGGDNLVCDVNGKEGTVREGDSDGIIYRGEEK